MRFESMAAVGAFPQFDGIACDLRVALGGSSGEVDGSFHRRIRPATKATMKPTTALPKKMIGPTTSHCFSVMGSLMCPA